MQSSREQDLGIQTRLYQGKMQIFNLSSSKEKEFNWKRGDLFNLKRDESFSWKRMFRECADRQFLERLQQTLQTLQDEVNQPEARRNDQGGREEHVALQKGLSLHSAGQSSGAAVTGTDVQVRPNGQLQNVAGRIDPVHNEEYLPANMGNNFTEDKWISQTCQSPTLEYLQMIEKVTLLQTLKLQIWLCKYDVWIIQACRRLSFYYLHIKEYNFNGDTLQQKLALQQFNPNVRTETSSRTIAAPVSTVTPTSAVPPMTASYAEIRTASSTTDSTTAAAASNVADSPTRNRQPSSPQADQRGASSTASELVLLMELDHCTVFVKLMRSDPNSIALEQSVSRSLAQVLLLVPTPWDETEFHLKLIFIGTNHSQPVFTCTIKGELVNSMPSEMTLCGLPVDDHQRLLITKLSHTHLGREPNYRTGPDEVTTKPPPLDLVLARQGMIQQGSLQGAMAAAARLPVQESSENLDVDV